MLMFWDQGAVYVKAICVHLEMRLSSRSNFLLLFTCVIPEGPKVVLHQGKCVLKKSLNTIYMRFFLVMFTGWNFIPVLSQGRLQLWFINFGEITLNVIFWILTNHRCQIFYTDYKRDLEKDCVSETSGHFKRLLVSMCQVINNIK